MNDNSNDKQPLRDVVFKAIRDDILSEKLVSGERLMEKHLADKLGVSRTPVREALSKLEQEGFIEMTPRKGATVSIVRKKDIEDVLKIRAVLEGLAAKLACQNLNENIIKKLELAKKEFDIAVEEKNIEKMATTDMKFHDIIFSLSGNQKLVQIISNLREQIYRYRVAYLKDKNYRVKIIAEHNEILNAIKSGDPEYASNTAMLHIQNQENAVVKSLK